MGAEGDEVEWKRCEDRRRGNSRGSRISREGTSLYMRIEGRGRSLPLYL